MPVSVTFTRTDDPAYTIVRGCCVGAGGWAVRVHALLTDQAACYLCGGKPLYDRRRTSYCETTSY